MVGELGWDQPEDSDARVRNLDEFNIGIYEPEKVLVNAKCYENSIFGRLVWL